MPGWQQIGAVWLPLPHVLNMVPVQVDAWYRTGASGIAISVAAMAVGAWALASLIIGRTGSIAGGLAGAALLLANPNVLYLQSTPMTEPLLFGTTLLAVALTAEWLDRGAQGWPKSAGLALVAACMTRYEAWPICGSLVALALAVLLRRNMPPRSAAIAVARLCFLSGDCGHPLLAQQPVDGGRMVRQQRLLRRRERIPGPAARRLGSSAGGGLSPVRTSGRVAGIRGRGPGGVDLCALARTRLTRACSGARRCRRAAMVRVRRRPSLPHPLRGPARGRVRGDRRDAESGSCRAACAPSPPHWRSRVRCGRSRHSIGRRRSSPNRNETRRISSDDGPSPNTSGRITTAARS